MELHVVVQVAAHVIVPVHVLRAVGAHTGLLIVDVALRHGILCDRVAPIGVEVAVLRVVVPVEIERQLMPVGVLQFRVAQREVQRVVRRADVDVRGHGREGLPLAVF